MNLPIFRPNRYERDWVVNELTTARFIRTLWKAASRSIRRDPAFLQVIVRSAWLNDPEGGRESTRRWRNGHIAAWLGLPPSATDEVIAQQLAAHLRISRSRANKVIRTPSGITHYYTAFRPGTIRAIHRHAAEISRAFDLVSRQAADVETKVGKVAAILAALPDIRVPSAATLPCSTP